MEEHYSNSDKDNDSVSVRKYDRTAEDDSEQYADLYEQEYVDYCKRVNRCIPWFRKK